MRITHSLAVLAAALMVLAACSKTDKKAEDPKPEFDLVPQRAQLQKAKDVEKVLQQQAEEERKVIEAQTNTH